MPSLTISSIEQSFVFTLTSREHGFPPETQPQQKGFCLSFLRMLWNRFRPEAWGTGLSPASGDPNSNPHLSLTGVGLLDR